MHMIRAVAAALLIAAVLMIELAHPFFTYWGHSVSFHAWSLAVHALSDSAFATLGVGGLALAVFICLCLALGLLASAVLYAPLDRAAAVFICSRRIGVVDAIRRIARHGAGQLHTLCRPALGRTGTGTPC